jgi:hypothetical protein
VINVSATWYFFAFNHVQVYSQKVGLYQLDMPLDRVKTIVNKLEEMKTFFYRYNCPGINWAYPVTTEDSGHILRKTLAI